MICDEESFVILSEPEQARLMNVARHPRVSFNLDATRDDEQTAIFTGAAEVIDRVMPPQSLLDACTEKYAQGMFSMELPSEQYAAAYTSMISASL